MRIVSASKNFIVDAAIVIALLLVGFGGYYFSPLLLPRSDVTATPDAGCNLQREACGAALPGGGRVELSISPRPIPNVKPLAVEVRVSGIDASKATLDLSGAAMNMGFNRTDLQSAGPGRFTGTTSIPVCATGAMEWIGTVVLEAGRQRISVPFRLVSSPR